MRIIVSGVKDRTVIIYFLTLLFVLGLKYHYSTATTEDLCWILIPTAKVTEQLSGIEFKKEKYTGFVNWEHNTIIAKSCAGVNFLIIAFCMMIFCYIHKLRNTGLKVLFVLQSLFLAYFFTIIVNSLRIIAGIYLNNLETSYSWLTGERIHRFSGIIIFFTFLCIIYFLLQRVFFGKTGKSFFYVPLFWYLLFTLIVPLLKCLYRGNRSGFFEHGITILIVSFTILFFFLLLSSIGRLVKNHSYIKRNK